MTAAAESLSQLSRGASAPWYEPARFGPRVCGNCLVVVSGTVLPPVCVKTNKSVTKGGKAC